LQAEALVSIQEAAQKKAKESLDATRTALQRAESERARIANVKIAGMISVSDRERIEAEASIKAAEVRAMEFSLQISDYELAQARAALTRPAVNPTENAVEMKSPVSGVVLKVMQESETIVAPGTGLLEVGDPNDLEIEAEILSRDAVSIKIGDAVAIEQWGSPQALKGRVRRVEPAAFTKVSALGVEEQRVIVLVDLVDPPAAAKALGDRYRVEARIAIWHADEVLVVPASALFREGNTWKTYRYEQGKAYLTTIEVGHSDGRLSEVNKGLKEGDRVLLHPPDSVKDQSSVVERTQN
jgi:HlyD family secretion protein